MEREESYDILIVGAGMVGLALAARLAGSGLRLALIDAAGPAAPPPEETSECERFDPRVSALTVASEALLRDLGVWEAIEPRACAFRHMRVWDAEGTGSIHFSADDLHRPALGHIAENSRVLRALEEKLSSLESLELLRGVRVDRIEPLAPASGRAPRYRMALEDGGSLSARLLVGADGAASLVRGSLGFKVKEWDYGHRAIVATVKCEDSHRFTAWQRFMPSGPLAFLPLLDPLAGDGEPQRFCSIVWSCRNDLAEELMALDEPAFNRRLQWAFEERLGKVLASSPRFAFPLRQMHALDYVEDGVALVGDAAHTIHPLAGQGVNLGLQDVAVLAQVIREALQSGEDFASHRVLSRYQRRRKGPNLGMMAVMEGFKRLFESESLPLQWLRNTGFNTVDRLPLAKRQLMARAMGLQ